MSRDDIPPAVVVQDGKLPGDVPNRSRPEPPPPTRHHRKLANYLLDKRLQLRYVLIVTVVSAVIAGTLGWLIYQQEHRASEDLVAGLAVLTEGDATLAEFERDTAADIAARDRRLVLEMVGVGLGLTLILSLYLLVMTHKVAGPLYKVGLYMEKMAEGRLGEITALRRGDMLQDFYSSFHEMHDAVRARLSEDAEAMARLAEACAAAPGEISAGASDELDELAHHAEARRKALA